MNDSLPGIHVQFIIIISDFVKPGSGGLPDCYQYGTMVIRGQRMAYPQPKGPK